MAVCIASSGPGVKNLTAVADANMDSIPIFAISAQVSSELLGTDAFQEADTFGLMSPITKHNYLIRTANEILTVIPEACQLAKSGRPGPISIDIPKDVLLADVDIEDLSPVRPLLANPLVDNRPIDAMRMLLAGAERPILMVGGGAINSECFEELRLFFENEQMPVVTSFMGLGIIPHDYELHLRMMGMHGARYTNIILHECDLLIASVFVLLIVQREK